MLANSVYECCIMRDSRRKFSTELYIPPKFPDSLIVTFQDTHFFTLYYIDISCQF